MFNDTHEDETQNQAIRPLRLPPEDVFLHSRAFNVVICFFEDPDALLRLNHSRTASLGAVLSLWPREQSDGMIQYAYRANEVISGKHS